MRIKKIISYANDENCYFVTADGADSGFLIDPGCDVEKIRKETSGFRIEYILLTHCHYDHIEGLNALRSETGARVASSFNCNMNIQNPKLNLSIAFSESIICEPADIILEDGETMSFCGIPVTCIHTPGHTNGGVCYLAEDNLFSGDTLFLRSVGRCDLPTGDADELMRSIKNKLYTLDDEINVFPGHGNDTMIRYEKMFNMYVRA